MELIMMHHLASLEWVDSGKGHYYTQQLYFGNSRLRVNILNVWVKAIKSSCLVKGQSKIILLVKQVNTLNKNEDWSTGYIGVLPLYVCHTHSYNWSTPSCYSGTAACNDRYSELTPNTVLANCYGLVSMTHTNAKAMFINDNDYSCHITGVELV